ncbi:unnamed protein product, partial [Aphanomyces euteiches]
MAKLREARRREIQALTTQIQNLESVLQHLQAHPDQQQQRVNPFEYARRVQRRRKDYLTSKLLTRARLIQSLTGWTIPQQLSQGYIEIRLANAQGSRQSGVDWLTKKPYHMSLQAEPFDSEQRPVEDDIKVKVHVGDDDNGTFIHAIEYRLQFTIFANFENVAKTWWFPRRYCAQGRCLAIDCQEFREHIVYVVQENSHYKYRRLSVVGVFLDDEKDRITITQTGIALDDRFPFTEGESRKNGFQWVVFQHVTYHVTIVRWSNSNLCPVNANGRLALRQVAEGMRCDLNPSDSDELIVAKIESSMERALLNIRDLFRHRCG